MSRIEEIGEIVKRHRKKSGLSRKDLATYAGVGKTTIFELENGRMTIGLSTLLKILAILNIRLELAGPLISAGNREGEKR